MKTLFLKYCVTPNKYCIDANKELQAYRATGLSPNEIQTLATAQTIEVDTNLLKEVIDFNKEHEDKGE